MELFTWLAEISEDAAEYDGAKIVWSVKFEPHQEDTEGRKNFTKLDVEKDDIQAVVPISKVSVIIRAGFSIHEARHEKARDRLLYLQSC